MSLRPYFVAFAMVAALVAAPVAEAAPLRYTEGQQVSLTIGQIPAGYTTYWVSSKDGYITHGNPLRTSALTVGAHTITALLFRNSDSVLVYRGSVEVAIDPKPVQQPTPTPTPPTGTTASYAPGEFEPVQELLLGCPDVYMVRDLYPSMIDAMRGVIPTTIYCDTTYVRSELQSIFRTAGVDDADVRYVVTPIDSIWMRDYGPLFVKRQGALEVVDLKYYPGRASDDAVPQTIARQRGWGVRRLDVFMEGGNFTADGRGRVYASNVVYEANYDLTRTTVKSRIESAFLSSLTVLEPMEDDGGTGHIDMYLSLTSASTAVVSKFAAGYANQAILDRQAATLRSQGYTTNRIDLADRGFSSHTNALLANGVALVPTYGNSVSDAAALKAFRDAGYRAVGIDCRRIIQWSGAIHCITITVPR